ncbi:hypothetical protein FA15DRAFT_760134 [Coprinopsis marcescibilis]|uniref:Uncharacterized protein n=1 Tax=Coprinopsis marcescibilis TaxID=230819 RepID=A0A5C3KHR2_COPMA|nr:hypothetical protein FA15DRAFT_760134 [Coprinopsis marcescibilis]
MNVTVDDAGLDPFAVGQRITYDPPQLWRDKVVCRDCGLADKIPEISAVARNGTAVYPYFLLFHRALQPNARGESKLFFFIDDDLKKTVDIWPTESPFTELWASNNHFLPSISLFSAQGLSESTHSIRIEWSHISPDTLSPPVVVALDYIEYTAYLFPNPAANESKAVPNRVIIGASIGGAALLSLTLIALFFWRYKIRKRNRIKVQADLSEAEGHGVSPFMARNQEQVSVTAAGVAGSSAPPAYCANRDSLIILSPVQDGASIEQSNMHTSTQTSPVLLKSPMPQ